VSWQDRLNGASTALPYMAPDALGARPLMIDNLTILLTHGLMLIAAWRLLKRPDLDREGPPIRRGIDRGRRDA